MNQLLDTESKILNSDLNLPARARALDELYKKHIASPPEQPDWMTTPTVTAELRQLVQEIKSTGASITAADVETEKFRATQDETRAKIRQLEISDTPPTLEMARELSDLKTFDLLLHGYLEVIAGRRAVASAQTWARVQRLARRLYELTNRSHWNFTDKNLHRPEGVWRVADAELSRILRGELDAFDMMNASGQPGIPQRAPRQIFV